MYEAFHDPGGVLNTASPTSACLTASSTPKSQARRARHEIRMQQFVGRLFTIEQMIGELGFHAVFVDRRLLSDLDGHPGRLAQRRAVGERAVDPLQPDARAGISRTSTRRCRPAARGGHRRRQHRDGRDARLFASGWARKRSTASTAATRTEAPARAEEIHHAQQEGVEFQWLTSPLELIGDDSNNVRAMRCERMAPGDPTPPAGAGRCPCPAAPSRSRPTWWCSRSRDQRQPDHRPDLRAEVRQARLHRHRRDTWPPRSPVSTPVATSSPGPPP